MREMTMPALLCGLLLAACTERPTWAGDLAAPPGGPGRVVTVTGSGRLTQAPGQVEFDALVSVGAPTPDAAWLLASARLPEVLRALQGAGVPAEDMALRDLALAAAGPEGHRIEQRLHVLVTDLGRLPPVLAAAAGSGVTAIENARFLLADPHAAADRARERALLDARDKADVLAQEVGLRLGEVRSVVEHPAGGPGGLADLRDPPGSLEAVSTVTVTWALID